LTEIETKGDEVTVNVAVLLIDPNCAVMTVVPGDCPVATPLVIVATVISEELHEARDDTDWVDLSENVPVAEKACVVAGAISAVVGLMAIDLRTAELTFNSVEPDFPPKLATICVAPFAMPCATPEPLMVATLALLDDHATSRFRGCVVESLNVPVARYGSVVVGAMVWPTGVKEMDRIVASVTLRSTDALAEPSAALMVVEPGSNAFATGLFPEMVATFGFEEVQVTFLLMFRVPPSSKSPIAVKT
jgi:hypothetical protein